MIKGENEGKVRATNMIKYCENDDISGGISNRTRKV